MESEEENDRDSVKVQLVTFDYGKFSSIGKTPDSSKNLEDSATEEQSKTGKLMKKMPAIIITD
jgi:hypothetical protein